MCMGRFAAISITLTPSQQIDADKKINKKLAS